MNLSTEEKLMYEVMKAIYDSRIPVSFKGSMVMKACLLEAGYTDDTRHTVDIDANWNSDIPPTGEQLVESLQKAIDNAGIELDVSLYRMYGEGRSAGFELRQRTTGEILFTMDMDVNRPAIQTRIYQVEGLHFRGIAPVQMLADKISSVSTDKVFRRIKDVVDLYYFAKVFEFDRSEILETLHRSGRKLEDFNGFLHRSNKLKHSYEKFRFSGNVEKPAFDDVYAIVKSYIGKIIPKEKDRNQER